jgi:hypothetical protein
MTLPVLATRMLEHVSGKDWRGFVLTHATKSSIVDCWGVVKVQDKTLDWSNSAHADTSVSAYATGSTVATICAESGAHRSWAAELFNANVLTSCTTA